MLKRILAIALVVLLALSATACGKSNSREKARKTCGSEKTRCGKSSAG